MITFNSPLMACNDQAQHVVTTRDLSQRLEPSEGEDSQSQLTFLSFSFFFFSFFSLSFLSLILMLVMGRAEGGGTPPQAPPRGSPLSACAGAHAPQQGNVSRSSGVGVIDRRMHPPRPLAAFTEGSPAIKGQDITGPGAQQLQPFRSNKPNLDKKQNKL